MSGAEHPRRPDGDDPEILRAYAAASTQLDEAPSAATRSAILAAARNAPPGQTPQRRPWSARWPLAAAATLLISTIAVLVAQRVEDDAAPVAGRTTVPQHAPSARTGAATSAQRAVPSEADMTQRGVVDRRRSSAAADHAAPAPSAPPAAAQSRAPSKPADASAHLLAKQELTAAPPPPAPAAPALPEPAARDADQSPVEASYAHEAQREIEHRAMQDALKRSEAGGAADNPSRLTRQKTEPTLQAPNRWRTSVKDWIDYIVQLRTQGRAAEADEELALLRRHHPDAVVPASALPQ